MEKEKLFPIGEVAKLYHISVGNLRHYEKIGLLKPEYVNPSSGYRYYSVAQFECLNTIRYLRSLDISLDAIRSFINNRDMDQLEKILLEQQEAVKRKQEELALIARKVELRIEKLRDCKETDANKICVKQLPKRRLVVMNESIVPDNYLSLELFIRELDNASDSIFLGKVGLGLSEGSLLAGRFCPYDIVFLQLDDEDDYQGKYQEIGSELCVTIRFRGSHREAPAYYDQLMTYIQSHGYQISGFSKEITLVDCGFTNDENLFVTEIQIPVCKK